MKKVTHTLFGSRKKKVVSSVLTAFLAAGVGIAAWQIITATGSGSAKVGSLIAPTINAGETASAGTIYPSDTQTPTGGIRMSIDNPNGSTLYLKSFTADATNVSGGVAACDFSQHTTGAGEATEFLGWAGGAPWYLANGNVGGVTKAFTGLSIAVPTGNANSVVVPLAIYATDALQTQCQGQAISGIAVTNATFSTAP